MTITAITIGSKIMTRKILIIFRKKNKILLKNTKFKFVNIIFFKTPVARRATSSENLVAQPEIWWSRATGPLLVSFTDEAWRIVV